MKILVVNVGSTSLKFRLFEMGNESLVAMGKVERVGSARSPLSFQLGNGPKQELEIECPDQRTAIKHVLKVLTDPTSGALSSLQELDAIGFKPVHGRGHRLPSLQEDWEDYFTYLVFLDLIADNFFDWEFPFD